jgi:hypothetical protein
MGLLNKKKQEDVTGKKIIGSMINITYLQQCFHVWCRDTPDIRTDKPALLYPAGYWILKLAGYPAKLKTISIHKISKNVILKPLLLLCKKCFILGMGKKPSMLYTWCLCLFHILLTLTCWVENPAGYPVPVTSF